jgi:hypothetical protein
MSNSIGFGDGGPSGTGPGGLLAYEAFTNLKSVVEQSRILSQHSGSIVPPFKTDRP